MARDAGANKVYMTSAAPPIRYPNIYGIDIPTRHELVAYERNDEEIAEKLGCDWIVYQRLNDLEDSVNEAAERSDQCEFLEMILFLLLCISPFVSLHSHYYIHLYSSQRMKQAALAGHMLLEKASTMNTSRSCMIFEMMMQS